MLNLIKSNRMERLVQALCATLEQVPPDPMAAEWIGIQSRGMKQWLTTSIARHFGICANVAFLFPRQILEGLFDLMPGQGDDRPSLSRERISWAVTARLASSGSWPPSLSGPGGPAGYVKDDLEGRKTWQLSRSIARVFDDYQVYRPDLLARWAAPDAWEKEEAMTGAAWQAWLWQELARDGMPLLSGTERIIQRDGLELLKNCPGLPGRICLFGVSNLPPRFLEVFSALGRILDIFLFVLTPSNQFFYDLGSERQAGKRLLSGGEEGKLEDLDTGSPLLRSLGRTGREFHGILENFDYHEPMGELFGDPLPPDEQLGTMLQVLQSDILNLVRRGKKGTFPPQPVVPEDRSVSLHACHSPMREAQVLKDLVLDILDRDAGTAPHDIIVMMPDIEAYAPSLEAVFSQEPRLPFTVSDRRKRSESRTIEAFLKILDLRGSRLERADVLDLLRSPAIARKFDISEQDQPPLAGALSRARLFWGRDSAHRRKVSGMGFEENTWAFGLSRLLLGTALPAGERALAGTVLPCDGFEGLEAEVLGRFAHFTATLFRGLDSLETPKTVREWARCLRRIILSMMAPEEGQGDLAFLLTALDDLSREAEAGGSGLKIGFPVMEEALVAKLDQTISQGSFMAGSITLCNLMPMRSIPFKVVCLMGMDGLSFPRQAREPGFNLMTRFPRAGDKQVREEDCYLFLESLLSARSRLVITYTGMSISDNSPVPCAGPVELLKDTVGESFVFPKDFQWIFFHALHPFSPIYFDPDRPQFFSFSRSQCDIASAQEALRFGQGKGAGQDLPWLGVSGADKGAGFEEEALDINTLVRFFRRPAETFLRQTLGLGFFPLPEAEQDRERFQVSGLDQYSLGSACLDSPEDPELFSRVLASGRLPLGQKGALEWERIQGLTAPVQALAKQLFPVGEPGRLDIGLTAGGLAFTGQVGEVYDGGRYVKTFGRLTPDRLLTQWILHLFYCAAGAGAGETRLVGQDRNGRKPALTLGFGPLSGREALDHLDILARLYTSGMARGLAFACTPCFHLAESLYGREFDLGPASLEEAVRKARPFWTGGLHARGEVEDRYTARVFGSLDPFAHAEAVQSSGVLETSLAVFRPLMEAMD